jgi:hypothetical protein
MGGEIWPPPPRPERDWDREGPRGRSRSRSGSPARSRRGGYSSRSRSRSLDRRRAARSSWSRSRSRSRSGSRGRRRRPFDPRDVDVDDAGRPHAAAGLGFDEEINPKADALLDAAASGGDGRIWEHDDRDRKRKRKRGRGGSPSASRRSRSRRHSRGGSDDDDDDDDDDEPEKPSAAKTVDQETMLRMEIEASAAEKRNPEQRLDQLNLGWNSETAAVFKRAREKIRGVSGNSFDPLQLALERAQERRRTNAADAMEKLEERKNARGKLRRSRKDGDDRDDDGRRTYGKLGGMGDIDAYGKNKGVDARTERDARATRDTSAEGIAKALERKASTYAKLAAGEYDEKDADKYDVDFHAKGAMGRAGNAMAELEEEARKRDLGASIAFDYGRGGMPEWRGGAPPPPPPDLVRVREVPPPPPMAMMPPPMMTVPPPPVMPPPLVPPPPPPFG